MLTHTGTHKLNTTHFITSLTEVKCYLHINNNAPYDHIVIVRNGKMIRIAPVLQKKSYFAYGRVCSIHNSKT